MAVVLATRRRCTEAGSCARQVEIGGDGADLEQAFADIIPDLLALCRDLGAEDSAVLAHTPSAATNAADLGEMMAWTRLVDGWAAGPDRVLAICDDPWMFRHLALRPGVTAGRPPPLWPAAMRLWARGATARLAYAWAAAWWALTTPRPQVPAGRPALLSYAHPASAPDHDAYFGDVMTQLPRLRRVIHVDGPPQRVRPLAADGRTDTLHAWGRVADALWHLPRARWTPRARGGPWAWLVRRAAALEGSGAQGASIRWQILCQRAWLDAAHPATVAWPWENHGWERDLVHAAASRRVATIGYQHATLGRFELNHHAGVNADGLDSVPDTVLCSGPVWRRQLVGWGLPEPRCRVGGALRQAHGPSPRLDPSAPVFVALPSTARIAGQMVDAVQRAATLTGRRFVVRDHPMYPVAMADTPLVCRATAGLADQPAVSAVVFAATTVGLEAVLMGLPTIRFVASGCIAPDILPNNVVIPAAGIDGLATALDGAIPPPVLDRTDVFAAVDTDLWRRALEGQTGSA